MGTVWNRQIRPAIVLGSFVIFYFLVLGRHSSGSISDHSEFIESRPNLRQKFVPVRAGRHNVWESEGKSRHLLADYDENSGRAGEEMSSDSISVAEGDQELELSVQNETLSIMRTSTFCVNVREHPGYSDSCSYVKAIQQCRSGTLIEYTQFFYCRCADRPILGYLGLVLWLVALFYMLGNTAADFFCISIDKLSKLLHLPPTVAGVTLLPLGNGAPDVFASIAAFVGTSGQGQVGLNSVLGGATFVSSVVAGILSLMVAAKSRPRELDGSCFLRDVGFFLVTLASLTAILFVGEIHFWGAIGYISIYALYAVTVAAVEFVRSQRLNPQWHALQPLLAGFPNDTESVRDDESGIDGTHVEFVDNRRSVSSAVETSLPQWMWARHVKIYSHQSHLDRQDSVNSRPLWGFEDRASDEVKWYSPRGLCLYFIEFPLAIPRRLTIPVVEDQGWSRVYAVCSATFAPSLLAMVWDGKDNEPFGSAWKEYIFAGSLGIMLCGISLFTLKKDHPPRRWLFPWAAGGFVMSIVWFYVIANELVAVLVSLGVVFDIDAAILGLTLLAWGNSIGDLVSNIALVSNGGDGVQIAFSGCYAGPMFNTLIGVGISFILASWKTYPAAFSIPQDDTIFMTIAFLVAGLVWALYMLPSRKMQPTKPFGVGLLILYASFLMIRLADAMGLSNNWLGTGGVMNR